MSVSDLSAISAALGTIHSGLLNNLQTTPTRGIRLSSGFTKPASWTDYIDFAATGAQPIINFGGVSGQFRVEANGNAYFGGQLVAASGDFAGALSAATGTFAGDLSAAGGTFAGALSAATGTFAGDISAASGTFSGTVGAGAVVASGNFSAASASFAGNVGIAGSCFAFGLECEFLAVDNRPVVFQTLNVNGTNYDFLVGN